MKKQDFLDAFGGIDPKFIEEADLIQKPGQHRRQIRQRFVKIASAAACFCLIVLAVKWAQNSGFDTVSDESDMQSQNVTSSNGSSSGDLNESQDQTDGMLSSAMAPFDYQELEVSAGIQADNEIALKTDDFTMLTVGELESYLEVRVQPQNLPEGFAMAEGNQSLGTYEREDGTIYYDQNVLTYQNENGDSIQITTSKCRQLHWDTDSLPSDTVGHYQEKGKDCFEMGFQYGDVWFYLTSKGISQETFEEIATDLYCQ